MHYDTLIFVKKQGYLTFFLLSCTMPKKLGFIIMEQRYITVEAIARDLDNSPDLVRLWIRQKKLPAVKIGKEYRVLRTDYEKFLQERRTK